MPSAESNNHRNLETLQYDLRNAAGYLQEAWRLTDHIRAIEQGKKSVLSESLQPKAERVRINFQRLAGTGGAQGRDLIRQLQGTAKLLQMRYGPLDKWVEQETARESWESLASTLANGVDQAIERVKFDQFSGHDLLSDIWKAACKAGHRLDYVCRVANLLGEAMKIGELPPGCHMRRANSHDSYVVEHQVVDAGGKVLGAADFVEGAVEDARKSVLASRDYADLTLDQFKLISTVIQVVPGRGKTGQAATGKDRLLVADPADLVALRMLARRAYHHGRRNGVIEAGTTVDEYVSTTVRNLLENSFEGEFNSMRLKGLGHLVLVKDMALLTSSQVLEVAYRGYQRDDVELPEDALVELDRPRMTA